jgi:hypothetical protein
MRRRAVTQLNLNAQPEKAASAPEPAAKQRKRPATQLSIDLDTERAQADPPRRNRRAVTQLQINVKEDRLERPPPAAPKVDDQTVDLAGDVPDETDEREFVVDHKAAPHDDADELVIDEILEQEAEEDRLAEIESAEASRMAADQAVPLPPLSIDDDQEAFEREQELIRQREEKRAAEVRKQFHKAEDDRRRQFNGLLNRYKEAMKRRRDAGAPPLLRTAGMALGGLIVIVAGSFLVTSLVAGGLKPIVTDAETLAKDHQKDPASAKSKYVGRTVEVTGVVKKTSERFRVALEALDDGPAVECLISSQADFDRNQEGDLVTLRGERDGQSHRQGSIRIFTCFVVK